MRKEILALGAASLLALASCSAPEASSAASGSSDGEASSGTSYDVRWVTPTGSPTLCFYDQGGNENWISSSTPATTVVPAFTNSNQDAIVFDGVSGLSIIKKNGYDYKLAAWLTGGSFYVVSTKYSADSIVTSGITVDAFVETGTASKVFNRLASESWGFSDMSIDYETGVANVRTKLVSDPDAYDYYVIAEPVLTAAKKELAAAGTTLNVVYDLQAEWKAKYGQAAIPAAALFVCTTSYADAAKKDAIDDFIDATAERAAAAVDSPEEVASAIEGYSSEASEQQSRFGYTAALVRALQADGANRFSVLKRGDVADNRAFANDYEASLGESIEFEESLFLS